MRIGLSFLGLSRYQVAAYYWKDKDYGVLKTNLFPETLPAFFSVTELIVFVTKEAKGHEHCRQLKENLGDTVKMVEIPSGKKEEELWEIFDIVAKQVPPNSTIIMDITHAFRSLPMVIYNVALYLRRIKNIKIERIIYGNWEARDKSYSPPLTPIFDLTPTLDLQDWLHGIDYFQRRGDAEELANSLSRTQGRLYQTRDSGKAKLPRKLVNMARGLNNFSEALRLLRPLATFQTTTTVCNLLESAEDEVILWAKPFADILQDLNKELSPLVAPEPTNLSRDNLRTQLKLVHYYLDKDLVVQAVLLAREWLVSCLMLLTDRELDWRDRKARVRAERELGRVYRYHRKENDYKLRGKLHSGVVTLLGKCKLPSWYRDIPQASTIRDIWDNLSKLRNDVAHCAMNTDAISPEKIRSKIRTLIPDMEALLI